MKEPIIQFVNRQTGEVVLELTLSAVVLLGLAVFYFLTMVFSMVAANK